MKKSSNDKSTLFLYNTKIGKIILSLMLKTKIPAFLATILRSPFSKFYINLFIKKHNIDMSDFENVKFKSFNDFFTRKKEITFDNDKTHLISPADSLVSSYKITENAVFNIKNFDYKIEDFFDLENFPTENKDLAKKFADGICVVFRLCATDYHRYIYIDNAKVGSQHFISGSLYSVQPAACENFRVFTKNRRAWTILKTENFGTVAQIEVGAFSVGGIINHHKNINVNKGHEKGYFDLHGSTIVLLFEKDKIKLLQEIEKASKEDSEFRVKAGQYIGNKI